MGVVVRHRVIVPGLGAVGLVQLGEHERARALAEDTLTRSRRVLGDDHADIRRSVAFLQWLDEQAR